MKRILFCIILFSSTGSALCQTQLFFEDFESGAGGFTLNTSTQGGVNGTSGENFWVVNNNYAGGSGTVSTCIPLAGFPFTIPPTPAQPGGISNANGGYLHMLSAEAQANGITSTSHSPAENTLCVFSASHFSEMTANINTSNFNAVTLDFWWLNNNSTSSAGQLWYSTDGGSTWTQKTGTNFYGMSTWTNTTLTDAAWDGQTTLKFGFRFDNVNTTGAADPSLAIDEIEITGTLVTPCSDSNSSFSVVSCDSYTVPSGDETYTVAGTSTVMDTILNVSGCDSIMTISLTINTVDASATNNMDGTATANSSTGVYQWYECDSNLFIMINGATSATHSATSSGGYAVVVTDNGCTDTSACLNIAVGGFEEFLSKLEVYPNPSKGQFTVEFGNYSHEINMTIADLSGKVIYRRSQFVPNNTEQIELKVAPGVYILNIHSIGSDVLKQVRITIE